MWVTTVPALASLARARLNLDLPNSLTDRCAYGGVFCRFAGNGATEHTR
jgi:hypothetical protein